LLVVPSQKTIFGLFDRIALKLGLKLGKQSRIKTPLEGTSYGILPLKIQNSTFRPIFNFSYSQKNSKKNCISFIWFSKKFVVFLWFYLIDFYHFLLCFLVVFKSKIQNCWNGRNSNCWLYISIFRIIKSELNLDVFGFYNPKTHRHFGKFYRVHENVIGWEK